jgi:broad specificity phosphatase PhoE
VLPFLRSYPRLSRVASILFPLLAGAFALWLLEASKASSPVAVREVSDVAPTRLVIFWIDSLAQEEAENPQLMPRMHERIAREGALHGPVRACADAVSVPCFMAMITGVDRFSVFALGRNFGGSRGALEGSVLQALQSRNKRIGYLGVPMFKDVLDGLEVKIIEQNAPDAPTIGRALTLLEREHLDLVIIHLHETDDYAHRLGPDSATYKGALQKVDVEIDRAFARLRPSDHAMIMGDHGHTSDGRHFAGLDVPTYAAFFGPLTRRNVERPMALTDYGAVWGRLFGVQFGERSWVDDYFDDKPLLAVSELPSLPAGAPTPLWAGILCVAIGAMTTLSGELYRVVQARHAAALPFLLIFATSVRLGASWLFIRPLISFLPLWQCLLIVLATGVMGGIILRKAFAGQDGFRFPIFFLAAALLSIPTVYKYGGAFAAMTWLGIGILWLAFRALRQGQLQRAAALALLWVPLYTIYNPAVRSFSVRWFHVYSEWIPEYASIACVAWLFCALVIPAHKATDTRPLAIGVFVGLSFAALRGVVPAWWFALPCGLAAPLCFWALRRPAVMAWALACSIPALWFFAEGDAVALGPTAAVLVLWSALPLAYRREPPLVRALVLVTLIWMTFWASMGCRLTGVTFNFFFAWLPADVPVTRTWLPHAFYTLAKYVLPPALGFALALRTTGSSLLQLRPLLDAIARARLGLVIAFTSAFSFASPDAGPFITADVVQEAALWMILVAFIGALPSGRRASATAALLEREGVGSPSLKQRELPAMDLANEARRWAHRMRHAVRRVQVPWMWLSICMLAACATPAPRVEAPTPAAAQQAAPSQLCIVRHAEAWKNVNPRPSELTAEQLDQLTPRGQEQARALAATLPRPVALVWSSPATRTQQTAEPLGLDVTTDIVAELRPLDGDVSWEERLRRWAAQQDPRPADGESLADGRVRAQLVLQRVRQRLPAGAHAVLVTHGDLASILIGELRGTPLLARPTVDEIGPGVAVCLPIAQARK